MNDEHIESKMNFIVEQQAQFASDIQRLEQSQARTARIVAEADEAVRLLEEAVSNFRGF